LIEGEGERHCRQFPLSSLFPLFAENQADKPPSPLGVSYRRRAAYNCIMGLRTKIPAAMSEQQDRSVIIMFMPVLSGLIVSADAFFIGLSLGLQKRCRFLHLAVINAVLLVLCILGFLIAERIYELLEVDTDLIVGFAFIALGLWCILQYFISKHIKRRKGHTSQQEEEGSSRKAIVLVGLVMSVEAMVITMGITFIFLPGSTFVIPATVALAHFGYSALSFCLARTKCVKRIPVVLSHVISGLALITYGLMALFVEFGI